MVDLNSTDIKKEKIKTTKKGQLDELTNLLKRIQADFENYKKRTEKERQEFARYACAGLACRLLPIIDAFEQALKNTADEGMKILYSQFMDVLSKQGLKRIDCVNMQFDPYMHEAMMTAASDKEPGTVLEELQAGFMLNGAVIRHAKVKVAKDENNKENAA